MSPLKLDAYTNLAYMLVTELTFQLEMSPLKLDAYANMKLMSVTELTSHIEMSVEAGCIRKHGIHVGHQTDIPLRNVSIEAGCTIKHVAHVGH